MLSQNLIISTFAMDLRVIKSFRNDGWSENTTREVFFGSLVRISYTCEWKKIKCQKERKKKTIKFLSFYSFYIPKCINTAVQTEFFVRVKYKNDAILLNSCRFLLFTKEWRKMITHILQSDQRKVISGNSNIQ